MSARIASAARAWSARLVLALGVSALPAAASLHAQAAWEAASCRVAPGHPSAGLHAPFDALLRGFVRYGTVDYRCFQAHEAALDGYLATLARTDAGAMLRDAALALWINAYNAFTIKLILSRYPRIESIKTSLDDGPDGTGWWAAGATH